MSFGMESARANIVLTIQMEERTVVAETAADRFKFFTTIPKRRMSLALFRLELVVAHYREFILESRLIWTGSNPMFGQTRNKCQHFKILFFIVVHKLD